ncbi:cupin [Sphingobium lactosutens]|uniref:cupin domain-containing protein n=1 Tax=Sphingobium lactosutens TaxID=522773 RepID=UPI0015BBF6C8|nr:cupin domain-containing protein [Sphingobium lactosutens]NWK96201.1 cupin [Sphingobium lactosutens]
MSEDNSINPALRAKLVSGSLSPLWESRFSHSQENALDDGKLWKWSELKDILTEVAEISSPAVVERRVLEMMDPREHYPNGEGAIGTITACVQMLKPGETARPHRHSMNAVRFVIEATGGAKTVVDGKDLLMETGDLVLTPGWCWHAHVHQGSDPVIWLDVLDLPLHRFLGTEAFQPGPISDVREKTDDRAFGIANIVPMVSGRRDDYSPVFRYPWADAVEAVGRAPLREDGTRQVRYANPLTGGAALPFLDFHLVELDPATRASANIEVFDRVCHVVEGSGCALVGDATYALDAKDVFTVPGGRPLSLEADDGGKLRIFVSSNQPVFERLGLKSRTLES